MFCPSTHPRARGSAGNAPTSRVFSVEGELAARYPTRYTFPASWAPAPSGRVSRPAPSAPRNARRFITTPALPRRPAEVDEAALDVGGEEGDAHAVADVEPLRSTHELAFHLRLPDANPGALRGRAGHDRVERLADARGQEERGRRLLPLSLDLGRVVLLLGAVAR